MSYDLTAVDHNGKVVEFDERTNILGHTHCLDNKEAWQNITYNYMHVIKRCMGESLYDFDGVRVTSTISAMIIAIRRLGDDVSDDPWEPTEGNVKNSLVDLLHLSVEVIKVCPNAVWRIY